MGQLRVREVPVRAGGGRASVGLGPAAARAGAVPDAAGRAAVDRRGSPQGEHRELYPDRPRESRAPCLFSAAFPRCKRAPPTSCTLFQVAFSAVIIDGIIVLESTQAALKAKDLCIVVDPSKKKRTAAEAAGAAGSESDAAAAPVGLAQQRKRRKPNRAEVRQNDKKTAAADPEPPMQAAESVTEDHESPAGMPSAVSAAVASWKAHKEKEAAVATEGDDYVEPQDSEFMGIEIAITAGDGACSMDGLTGTQDEVVDELCATRDGLFEVQGKPPHTAVVCPRATPVPACPCTACRPIVSCAAAAASDAVVLPCRRAAVA